MTESLADWLREAVFSLEGLEGAAYILCGLSRTATETRLLGREVVPVRAEHYLERLPNRLSIVSDSYVPMAKRAREHGEALIFVHSHPAAPSNFSAQDERELPKLMEYVAGRAPGIPHACLILGEGGSIGGRAWTGGGWTPLDRIRVLGRRFHFIDQQVDTEPLPQFFDRQVRAFGPDLQRLLRGLHVGVVGAGGTGSAVVEQLARLGVGTISVFDGDHIERSNVSRVYGSTAADEGSNKAELQARHVERIGIGTSPRPVPRFITDQQVALHLRDCDAVFGCTDKQVPRAILGRLSLRYLIPVFDTAVKIRATEDRVRGIYGRVTTLLPGEACLFCRDRISPQRMRSETLPAGQWAQEVTEGYADELDTNEPAVVMFTTAVAAQAVQELIHRLTGFMGEDTRSSEVLIYFDKRMTRTNREPPLPACQCMIEAKWGRGDTRAFLDMSWPESPG